MGARYAPLAVTQKPYLLRFRGSVRQRREGGNFQLGDQSWLWDVGLGVTLRLPAPQLCSLLKGFGRP